MKDNCGSVALRSTGLAATANASKRVDRIDAATMTANECGCRLKKLGNLNKSPFYKKISNQLNEIHNLNFVYYEPEIKVSMVPNKRAALKMADRHGLWTRSHS